MKPSTPARTHLAWAPCTRIALACLCALLTSCTLAATRAASLVVCAELDDSDLTRATYEQDAMGRLTHLDIVTPDTLWPAPGQPETPRFPAGQSDVSPNLADHPGVRIDSMDDASGALRVIDFASRTPDAPVLGGLRGSLMLHEALHGSLAIGSLYIAADGKPFSVIALTCRRFSSAGM